MDTSTTADETEIFQQETVVTQQETVVTTEQEQTVVEEDTIVEETTAPTIDTVEPAIVDTEMEEANQEGKLVSEGDTEINDESQQEQEQQQETIASLQNTNHHHHKEGECPHLDELSGIANEVKRILYKAENPSLCDICLTNMTSFLSMSDACHDGACRSCLDTLANEDNENDQHFPVQLELSSGKLFCFKCGTPHHLTEEEDGEKVASILEYIKSPESEEDLDKRRKAEQMLYVQELRREDMSLKHYLVEKQWGRTWMLFRTREGSPLPGKISNNKLARMNGTLDPNIRLPMDKYRPSPETHGDIISERLWSYLVKAYGVQGRAYSEDDIIAPEYARLRVYVDDYKKSIHLYP